MVGEKTKAIRGRATIPLFPHRLLFAVRPSGGRYKLHEETRQSSIVHQPATHLTAARDSQFFSMSTFRLC